MYNPFLSKSPIPKAALDSAKSGFDIHEKRNVINQNGYFFHGSSLATIEYLYNNNVDIKILNHQEQDVLFYAKSPAVLNFYLSKGLLPNKVDKNGENAFLYLLKEGYEKSAKILLEHPDNNIFQVNKYGQNALYFATSPRLLKILLKKGLSLEPEGNADYLIYELFDSKDPHKFFQILYKIKDEWPVSKQNGKNIFYYALDGNQSELFDFLITQKNAFKLLKETLDNLTVRETNRIEINLQIKAQKALKEFAVNEEKNTLNEILKDRVETIKRRL